MADVSHQLSLTKKHNISDPPIKLVVLNKKINLGLFTCMFT